MEGDGGVETAPAVDSLSPHSQRETEKGLAKAREYISGVDDPDVRVTLNLAFTNLCRSSLSSMPATRVAELISAFVMMIASGVGGGSQREPILRDAPGVYFVR